VPIIVAGDSGAFCHLGHRGANRRTRRNRSATSPQRPRDRRLAPFVHIQKQTGERNEAGQEEGMIISLYISAAVIMAVGSLHFAWRSRDFRKFLAGAFFVSWGILFYLYLADVSVPLLGTSFVETPQISGARSIVHFILLCFYFGFVRKPKA